MIFCDVASRYIHVEHEVALTSNKTIAAKVNFEQVAIEARDSIIAYHTDNGIYYQLLETVKEIHSKTRNKNEWHKHTLSNWSD